MTCAGAQSVISMRSVSRIGPIRVAQSKVTPSPSRWGEVNSMPTASCIHSTWVSIRRMSSHTCSGVAFNSVSTLMPATGRD
ncbi:MAG: hypothetical protein GWN79_14155 [Actinobacteria bacterium]|nr:hypothetical protein [Actinomycetota bacterium]NIS32798.1 hypothetical protein [Actinomycetota bacterium]NIT96460.1 hypothetical protein [Actinomycetota bacterium]NIU20157.1 hypothetical protein [Actinomycetota bacterium]NIU67776.1 hypothetical protein [Actinomycetota bacterium]